MYAIKTLTRSHHDFAPQFYSAALQNQSTPRFYAAKKTVRSYCQSGQNNHGRSSNSKTSKKNSRSANTKSMYPNLHSKVEDQLQGSGLSYKFYEKPKEQPIDTYTTSIMGRFLCHNSGCKANGWASKKICITIQHYRDNRYNANVYHQRCIKCNHLSKPKLDFSYADRVAYRLKRWNNIQQVPPVYIYQDTGAHQKDFCEACKAGVCSMASSEF